MLNYGPQDNQKFAILITPENFDLIEFMFAGYSLTEEEKCNRLGDYMTFTVSKRHQQSIANRKIETPDEIKAPWNKLNPSDRKIAYVSV
jgi:hypothetical protein